ncbi:hypothetical protein AMEX_G27977 [Astyanax mexicanus]|uniref:SET domain-containing protein n=1 Tax=Astyanax mexicanus TaxID=7994 RepID=A0A8T2KK32_ASTMX|nr:hypothetical protein AMEX_G27977 [Astyanax mexicanus]
MSIKEYIVFFRYQVPKVTSQMVRRAYETATKDMPDADKAKHFARRLPSESRVKAWIEKQGWSSNIPDAASIVQQWKPSGGIDDAMDSAELQKFCRTQRWKGLAVADVEGKGRGVVVTRPFALGEVVCDYHGKVVSRQEGLATHAATAEQESGYMFFFNSGQVARCIDAHEEECPCHPGMCRYLQE